MSAAMARAQESKMGAVRSMMWGDNLAEVSGGEGWGRHAITRCAGRIVAIVVLAEQPMAMRSFGGIAEAFDTGDGQRLDVLGGVGVAGSSECGDDKRVGRNLHGDRIALAAHQALDATRLHPGHLMAPEGELHPR